MIEKITKYVYENNVKKLNEIIDIVNSVVNKVGQYIGINANTEWEEWNEDTANSIKYWYDIETEEEYNALKASDNKVGEGATGLGAIAIGQLAKAAGSDSIAIGSQANVSEDGVCGVAIGYKAKADSGSTAVGELAIANGGSTSIGFYNRIHCYDATAVGQYILMEDSCFHSAAIGHSHKIRGVANLAAGSIAQMNSYDGIAIGDAAHVGNVRDWSFSGEDNYVYDSIAIGPRSNNQGNYSTCLGVGAAASQGIWYSSAIGPYTEVKAPYSTAIGYGSQTLSTYSTALGYCAKTESGENTIAIGTYTSAGAARTIAIGKDAVSNSGSDCISIGTKATSNSGYNIAIGLNTSAISGSNLISIGSGAKTSAGDNIAIGSSANADFNGVGSIALGSNSIANEDYVLSIGHKTYTNEDTGNQVNELKRRIINVAAGINDTDAVNVKQLKDQCLSYNNTASGDLALGNNNTFGEGSNYNVVVGRQNSISATETFVSGIYNTVTDTTYGAVFGIRNVVSGSYYTTVLGTRNQVNDNYESIIFGDSNTLRDSGGDSIIIGNRNQLGTTWGHESAGIIAIGFDSDVQADFGFAISGTVTEPATSGIAVYGSVSAPDGIAIGCQSVVTGVSSIALGSDSKATYDKSLALGSTSVTHADNTVSFGHSATDLDYHDDAYGTELKRRLTFVADGVTDSDAATVNQLKKVMPIGSIILHAGSTVPSGYLKCNGSAIRRDNYNALFTAIGTTYGTGDGSSTFNLPDLSANTPVNMMYIIKS